MTFHPFPPGEHFPPSSPGQHQASPLQVAQGQCFEYALPAGWQVVEDGQFAVVLRDPDGSAMTLLVGNCGYPPGMVHPLAFVHEKLAGLAGPQGGPVPQVWLGPPRPGRPLPGFPEAMDVDCAFPLNGFPWRGLATVSVRHGYGMTDLAVACAVAAEPAWPGYARWLPAVAALVAPTNGAAFGARGIAQQNLSNSIALGQRLQQHREHTLRLQQELADQRWRSDAERQQGIGEALTGQTWRDDPYGNAPHRVSTTPAVHWVDPQGRVVTSDDPSFDPRSATDPNWRKLPPLPPRG